METESPDRVAKMHADACGCGIHLRGNGRIRKAEARDLASGISSIKVEDPALVGLSEKEIKRLERWDEIKQVGEELSEISVSWEDLPTLPDILFDDNPA